MSKISSTNVSTVAEVVAALSALPPETRLSVSIAVPQLDAGAASYSARVESLTFVEEIGAAFLAGSLPVPA